MIQHVVHLCAECICHAAYIHSKNLSGILKPTIIQIIYSLDVETDDVQTTEGQDVSSAVILLRLLQFEIGNFMFIPVTTEFKYCQNVEAY